METGGLGHGARKEVPKGSEQVPKITLLCRRSVQEKVTENSLCNGLEVVDLFFLSYFNIQLL